VGHPAHLARVAAWVERQQDGGPVDAVEARDLLADEVQVGGPVALELLLLGVLLLCGQIVAVLGPVADGGDVVGERVEPDIYDVLGVAGNRDAPGEAGARDG